ncbi:MAG: vWA domain-containing protein [Bacteroidota bacterium]
MEFAFNYSPYWLIPILLVSTLLSWWLYRRTRDLLSPFQQVLLGILRFLAFSLVGFLLLEPLFNYLQRISYPPIVAVLQDTSESLLIQKDSTFVTQEYPQLLEGFVQSFGEDNVEVDLWGFSSQIQSLEQKDSLRFEAAGTNLSLALEEIQRRYQNQNLGAIVLASDGISTAGINPLFVSEKMSQPLYTVLLGDTTQQRDVSIQDLLYNEIAYLQSEMPIRCQVQILGYKRQPVKVSILHKGKVLDTQTLTLGGSQVSANPTFFIKPEETGLQSYTLQVSRLSNEISYRNNTRKIFVNVLETRRKIALFAGSPHPDIGALRRVFERDESYEMSPFILKKDGTFYNSPNTVDLEAFDLLLLHNFPQSRSDAAVVAQIRKLVEEENKPLMVFVGKTTDLQTLKPLYDFMGLTPSELKFRSEEVIANFLPAYQKHSTYSFEREWMNWANGTPPIFRNRSTWEAKATAEVFATTRIKNVTLDYPVYALQNFLGKKNMCFIGENFWRMRTHSYLERDTYDAFDDWVINNVKWLTVTDDKRKFIVEPAKTIFTGSEPVVMKGQAYDDSYNPISGVEIKVKLTRPKGTVDEIYLNEVSQGQYTTELFNLEEGTYSYMAEGRKNESPVGRDKGTFSIGRSNIEHFKLQANEEVMRQLALRTEGEFVYGREIESLTDKLRELPSLKPVVDFKTQRQSLIDFPWLLWVLLGLLGIEWIVRKWNSMS